MVNNKVAERIYEENGEVGFWYFYKDAILSHLDTIKENLIDGPRCIYQGIAVFSLGVIMTVGVLVAPLIFPFTKIRKARKAAKIQKEWVKNHK